MSEDLRSEDFVQFFRDVHNVDPFPWQRRLANAVFTNGWPTVEGTEISVLDVPTGAGKTAAIDVAIFHLALEADWKARRRAPVRILFVVDRRLIVDDAFARASKIAHRLANPHTDVLEKVASRLRNLSEAGRSPLAVVRLRGGAPKEPDWIRTPIQPTVVVSTVDQVGSRMLFRGYGVSDSMKSVHAGLLGTDALFLLDEAHLSQPFVQTAQDTRIFQSSEPWSQDQAPTTFKIVKLSATQSDKAALVGDERANIGPLLREDDRAHEVLGSRLGATKTTELIKSEAKLDDAAFGKDFAEQAFNLAQTIKAEPLVIAVVVNRVRRARQIFDEMIKRGARAFNDVSQEEGKGAADTTPEVALLIGRTRDLDRQALLDDLLPYIKAGPDRRERERTLFVVATQSIEAGADLDFDALVTEIAPLDSLRQRFGRLNRMGRSIEARGIIIAASDQVSKAAKPDPIYDDRMRETWAFLNENCQVVGKGKEAHGVIDFGIRASQAWVPTDDALAKLISPRPDAPVLLPRDIAFWTMTSPISAVDPEVSLYLHGPKSGAGDVEIVWRADIDDEMPEQEWIDRVSVCPPSGLEALSVPIGEAKRWLRGVAKADVPDVESGDGNDEEDERSMRKWRKALRWRGADSERTALIENGSISPGEMIVVPSSRGGCDRWGWDPRSSEPVRDLGRESNRLHRNRNILRLSRASPEQGFDAENEKAEASRLSEMGDRKIIAEYAPAMGEDELFEPAGRTRVLRSAKGQPLALERVVRLKRGSSGRTTAVARFAAEEAAATGVAATEGDDGMFVPVGAVRLDAHCRGVSVRARDFAVALGLDPILVEDIALAGLLHDSGKAHPAFKRLLYGTAVLAAVGGPPLAKSAKQRGSRVAYAEACRRAGLEVGARHEVASLAFAEEYLKTSSANDAELVLWLIGTHHGYGRPFFPLVEWPRVDGEKIKPGLGEQGLIATCTRSVAMLTASWADIAARVQERYGPWGLARLEAILRLADHRQSEVDAAAAEKEADQREAQAPQLKAAL